MSYDTWDYGEPGPRIYAAEGFTVKGTYSYRYENGRKIYSGWEMYSNAGLGKIYPTEEQARLERLAVAALKGPALPGGFLEAFSRLQVAPVEWVA